MPGSPTVPNSLPVRAESGELRLGRIYDILLIDHRAVGSRGECAPVSGGSHEASYPCAARPGFPFLGLSGEAKRDSYCLTRKLAVYVSDVAASRLITSCFWFAARRAEIDSGGLVVVVLVEISAPRKKVLTVLARWKRCDESFWSRACPVNLNSSCSLSGFICAHIDWMMENIENYVFLFLSFLHQCVLVNERDSEESRCLLPF